MAKGKKHFLTSFITVSLYFVKLVWKCFFTFACYCNFQIKHMHIRLNKNPNLNILVLKLHPQMLAYLYKLDHNIRVEN